MTTIKLITLSIESGNWWAAWTGPDEAQILKFNGGSNSMVTPFNTHAPRAMVVAHMEHLNPGYEVEVKL